MLRRDTATSETATPALPVRRTDWSELFAGVGLLTCLEALGARPLVRCALGASFRHYVFPEARVVVVVRDVAKAARDELAAEVACFAHVVGAVRPELERAGGDHAKFYLGYKLD